MYVDIWPNTILTHQRKKNPLHKKASPLHGNVHCCMKCPQILREKTSSEKYTVFSL